MKKTLLTILLFLLCSTVSNAATTWYACSGGGNWNGASVWTSVQIDQVGCIAATGNPVAGDTAILNSTSGNITITGAAAAATIDETGYTGTLAFGTQTLTISAGATLLGAMTNTSGTITITGGGVTLGGTPTGSYPTIKFTTAGGTLTSAGFTWPGAMTFNFAGTYTLSGNWINSGVTTFSSASIVNHTTTDTLTANGGLTLGVNTGAGNATINLGGGSWSGNFTLFNPLTFTGSSTVSGTVACQSTTLTYSSGTITTTSSTLNVATGVTLTTSGITWNNITTFNANPTITLGSNLTLTGTLTIATNTTTTFSGAFNISTANLVYQGSTTASNVIIPASQTLTVTNSMTLVSTNTTAATFKSGTSSTSFNLTYTGTSANCFVAGMTFTDVNAGGSSQAVMNYNGGTLTRTTNITNQNQTNFTTAAIGQGIAF